LVSSILKELKFGMMRKVWLIFDEVIHS